MTALLTQGQIEEQITYLATRMEDATDAYASVSERAAIAEADYRREQAIVLVAQLEHREKRSIAECQARVDAHCSDLRRAHLLADAERNAVREALLTMRTRMEALRTLAANVRHQT